MQAGRRDSPSIIPPISGMLDGTSQRTHRNREISSSSEYGRASSRVPATRVQQNKRRNYPAARIEISIREYRRNMFEDGLTKPNGEKGHRTKKDYCAPVIGNDGGHRVHKGDVVATIGAKENDSVLYTNGNWRPSSRASC